MQIMKNAGLCILMSLLACGCMSYASREKSIPQSGDGKAQQLEAVVQKHCAPFMDDYESVGLAVAVVSPDAETVMGFGRPALGSTEQVRGDSLFELGSITKTFTGLALSREVERGAVRLDQPVAELLPAGMGISADAHAVTLQEITTHTSGFPRLPGNFSLWHTFGKVITGGDPYADYSDGEFREAVRTVELDADPGTEFEYSNFAVGLLGYVLASKSGSDYETYIKAQVCEPLGMHDTGSTLSKDQAARFVQGYATMSTLARWLQYHRSTPWNIPNSLAGCGALRSSANDMLIYLKANMRPSGELAGAIRRSHHELYRGKEGPVIAMNWFRAWNTTLKKVIIWHNGETGGYHSYIGFTEDGSAGVVILANVADAKVEALAEKILVDVATSAVR